MLHQMRKQVKCLWFQGYAIFTPPKALIRGIKPKRTELFHIGPVLVIVVVEEYLKSHVMQHQNFTYCTP